MKTQQEDRDWLTGCCLVLDFDHVFLSIVEPFNNDAAYAACAKNRPKWPTSAATAHLPAV
jgi:hypothetical protein